MPAYKNKNGKWESRFTYTSRLGESKQVHKRGFKTKKEALAFEAEYKLKELGDVDMTFASYAELYKTEVYPRLKVSTTLTKSNIIDKHILPYFGKLKLSEISSKDVLAWQNKYLSERDSTTGKTKYTKSFLKTIHNQLSAMLNHAVRFHNLKENPAAKVGNMGTDKEVNIDFWTKEEYLKFRYEMSDHPLYYYCFEVLYWCGIREGELLALTIDDLDLENGLLNINKTYHMINGKAMVTSPKTANSERVVTIPRFLVDELSEYLEMVYEPETWERLFPVSKGSLSRYLKKGAANAGVKPIRVHDLRHSHVSLLINKNYTPLAIGKRVGHSALDVTYRYAHMFPSVQDELAEGLDSMMKEDY